MFCCKNAVYKHDFTSESIGKTSKLSDFDQFLPCDSVYTKMTSLGIPKIHKPTPEMERSRPVDSSRYQTFCLTPSEQKVIDQNILSFFLVKKNLKPGRTRTRALKPQSRPDPAIWSQSGRRFLFGAGEGQSQGPQI